MVSCYKSRQEDRDWIEQCNINNSNSNSISLFLFFLCSSCSSSVLSPFPSLPLLPLILREKSVAARLETVTIWYQSNHPGEAMLYLPIAASSRGDGEAEHRFSKVLLEIQESLVALNQAQGETQAAVVKMEQGVNSWRPQVEAAVQELREEVGDLRQQLDLTVKAKQASPPSSSPRVPLTDEERKAVQDLREEVGDLRQQLDLAAKAKQASPTASSPRVPLTDEERKAPLLPTPPTSFQVAAAEGGSKGACGRLQFHEHRGRVLGMANTLGPTPVKGTYEFPSTSLKNFDQFELGGGESDGDQFGR
jgi:hypothetical protein